MTSLTRFGRALLAPVLLVAALAVPDGADAARRAAAVKPARAHRAEVARPAAGELGTARRADRPAGVARREAVAGPRRVSPSKAARMIGTRVFVATGSAMPTSLIRPMREFAVGGRKARTDVYYMATFASAANFDDPAVTAKFHPHLFFVSMPARQAASEGRATQHRDSLYGLGRRIKAGEFDFDTVVVRVSPPDADGRVSLGTTGDLTMLAIEQVLARGGRVLAEVNPRVPFTGGKNTLRYDQLTAVVASDERLPENGQMDPTVAERRLGEHVARLVPDGATVQVGIGGAISSIGPALAGKRGLKIWSEMGSDWVLDLMQGPAPAATRGVFSFLHGTARLFGFADGNPAIRLDSSLVVNDPARIAKQPKMRAINTALEVDLLGNVNAEKVGDRVISAPGGQPDFMAGASKAPDGRAIMALRSTNKYGESTIVLGLAAGATTTPKQHVDHVVTEWGATRTLRRMSDGERAFQLISVAHPIHRAALAARAVGLGLIGEAQRAALAKGVYPALRAAPLATRGAIAQEAFVAGAITEAQHRAILATVPAGAPAGGPPLPPGMMAPPLPPGPPLPPLMPMPPGGAP